MKNFLTFCSLFSLLFLTWIIAIFHQGVFSTQGLKTSIKANSLSSYATFIPKSEIGINQLILKGSPLERGYAAGNLTERILYAQEKSLTDIFYQFVPNLIIRNLFIAALTRWYSGIEKYFEPWMLEEMYGVSLSTSHEFDTLSDRFSRQIAYHGLHEVGQMLIDNDIATMGCTVFAIPNGHSWMIGRNFDFEAGRIFDEEKIMKWVFPDQGNAFLSVIWAGMVGVVTGVNEKGVYISLNAAASDDSKRLGTPSTLVILKALQFANNAEEAKKIIEDASMFITDIFIVGDKSQHLYRIEKSPQKFESIELKEASVITNHLIGKTWTNDKTNERRKREITTLTRSERGELLLKGLQKENSQDLTHTMLSFLRDKRDAQANLYSFGNHNAIDSLVATHSVIYDAAHSLLYVSESPGLSNKFLGFDLNQSFHSQKPVIISSLNEDPEINPNLFYQVKDALKRISLAENEIKRGNCEQGKIRLEEAKKLYSENSDYYQALGNYSERCEHNQESKEAWKKALQLKPAYEKNKNYLKNKIEHTL